MLTIQLDQSRVAPGERLTGQVVWQAEKSVTPRGIDVAVGWRTSGRGDSDSGTVLSARHQTSPVSAGEKVHVPFEATLPEEATRSFSGRLIALRWFVSVRVDLPWAIDETAEAVVTLLPQSVRGNAD